MRAEELRDILDRRPLEPVRLQIGSGQAVDITRPGAAIVTRPLVAIGLGGRGLHEFVIRCNLLHTARIEPPSGRKQRATRRRYR